MAHPGVTRNLTCACCGDAAGRFEQHYNQDTGYGICRKCINWFHAEKRETPEAILSYYGIEGVNYAAQEQWDALKAQEEKEWAEFLEARKTADRLAGYLRESGKQQ